MKKGLLLVAAAVAGVLLVGGSSSPSQVSPSLAVAAAAVRVQYPNIDEHDAAILAGIRRSRLPLKWARWLKAIGLLESQNDNAAWWGHRRLMPDGSGRGGAFGHTRDYEPPSRFNPNGYRFDVLMTDVAAAAEVAANRLEANLSAERGILVAVEQYQIGSRSRDDGRYASEVWGLLGRLWPGQPAEGLA